MKLNFAFLLSCILVFHSGGVFSQESKKQYIHPLNQPIGISGSFGEYRNFSRFHMGLDYKTHTRNGLPVKTPLSGRIASIHVSQTRGYGNALFLKTNDGMKLTFAHLQDFNCSQEKNQKITDLEYFRLSVKLLTQDRSVKLRLPSYFRFLSGDCIGRTGESGSGPPHLHFEMIKNGVFLDPLSVLGLKISDHTPPVLLTLYIETNKGLHRVKLVRKNNTKDKHQYSVASPLPALSPNSVVKIMVGGYDTMSARNRNGLYSMALHLNGKKVYEKTLDRIRVPELGKSSQIYHTAYTQIGREYVYLLYSTKSKGYSLKYYKNKKNINVKAVLADASRNESIVQFQIPISKEKKTSATQSPSDSRLQADVPFRLVRVGSRHRLQSSLSQSKIKITLRPNSLQLNGKVRLFPLQSLPKEATEKLIMPVGHTGKKEVAFKLFGTAFYLDGLDLYYRFGGKGVAEFPISGNKKEGLYYYSFAKSMWRFLAHPHKRKNGKNHYRFRVRFTGPIAQLIDVSPPMFSRRFVWQKPRLLQNNKKVLVREYAVSEWGSGISLRNTKFLLDGIQVPWQWIHDRSLIRFQWPVALLKKYTMVSMQVGDQAGNLSKWHVEFIDKSWFVKK